MPAMGTPARAADPSQTRRPIPRESTRQADIQTDEEARLGVSAAIAPPASPFRSPGTLCVVVRITYVWVLPLSYLTLHFKSYGAQLIAVRGSGTMGQQRVPAEWTCASPSCCACQS